MASCSRSAAAGALVVTAVSARDRTRDRGVRSPASPWFDDPVEMAARADADVIVELIGGSDGPAKATIEAAIAARPPRRHREQGAARDPRHGAGRPPRRRASRSPSRRRSPAAFRSIKALREGLAANRITRVYGILNGTCNYILTVMRETGRAFADVLAEAQRLGYAEADPAFDIDGVDAAHKLAILAGVAFGTEVNFKAIHVEGIRHVDADRHRLRGRARLPHQAARHRAG